MKTERVFVVEIKEEDVIVSPMVKGECASCESGCAKRGAAYPVLNPRKLPVKPGQTVIVGASARAQAVQGVISLLIPFLCALLAFMLAPVFANLFGMNASEGFKAVSVLAGLFISSLAVLLITRKVPLPGKSEILSLAE